jgi:hypothetical protein
MNISLWTPIDGEVYLNAPLRMGLVTVPTDGSAKDTMAVLSGKGDSIMRALFPSTHVSACESKSK